MTREWKQPIHPPPGTREVREVALRVGSPSKSNTKGPELWAKLHSYRWTNYAEFRDWFDLWLAEVDKLPGCSCSQDFRSSILPQFTDRFGKVQDDGEWFTLTWEIHNAVNRKLGKREWSLNDAKAKRGEL